MKDLLDLSWRVAVIRGALGIVFGIVLAVWPVTALVFVLLWGIFVLVDGIGWFATGFSKGQSSAGRILSAILGLVAVAAGAFAIFNPGKTVAALIVVVGIWLIIRSVAGFAMGISGRSGGPRWMIFLSAALDLVLGVLFFLNPTGTATVFVILISITMIAWGIVLVVLGFFLRRAANELPEDVIVSI